MLAGTWPQTHHRLGYGDAQDGEGAALRGGYLADKSEL